MPASGPVTPLRVVLKAGGFAESVVVTGAARARRAWRRRRRRSRSSTPPTSNASVAADLTDVLKKNAGVDVVQYTGALSGIGIRGFRPQFSGINKRSLLLIDGRPSGVTNLATLLLDNVERIEVLKGAASAVYGSSAMGGVVNVITRQSRGQDRRRRARLGGGSFGTSEFAGRAGGSVVVARRLRRRPAARSISATTIRMGNGEVRPGDELQDLRRQRRASAWTLDGAGGSTAAANGYRGRDIMTPADIATGIDRHRAARTSSVNARTSRLTRPRRRARRCRSPATAPSEASHTLERHDDAIRSICRSCRICRSRAISAGPARRPRTRGTGRGRTASSSASTTRR